MFSDNLYHEWLSTRLTAEVSRRLLLGSSRGPRPHRPRQSPLTSSSSLTVLVSSLTCKSTMGGSACFGRLNVAKKKTKTMMHNFSLM